MKKWETINQLRIHPDSIGIEFKIENVVKILLNNRGIKTKRDREEFLNPQLEKVSAKSVGIDKKQLKKAIKRIEKAIKNKEQILIFADYDVDGICSAAILWETIDALKGNVLPYIPHRISEGYGLSKVGIANIKDQNSKIKDTKLIITVDNGIVANEAVEFANKQGIDVIVTDHHILPAGGSKNLPKAYAIVHTTKICGAGVAYLLTQNIKNHPFDKSSTPRLRLEELRTKIKNEEEDNHLELVALATVADLVPLNCANRTLLKFGLEKLRKTKRIGLLELFSEAGIDKNKIGVYEIGHIIAPRLNAMGRLEYAMESLRLLCTRDPKRARDLAYKLGQTNRERQNITIETAQHASSKFCIEESKLEKILFISNETYEQGIIGLVAGRLVEEFYRPAIVVSKGEVYSKASARSISGFNIIEFIRRASDLLVDCGGHPMAAGFTVKTEKLILLEKTLKLLADKHLDKELFIRTLKVDLELPLAVLNFELYNAIQKLYPFGMGNPEPVFCSRNALIEDIRLVGNGNKHVKFKFSVFSDKTGKFLIDAIAFGIGERAKEFHIADKVDIAYTLILDEWNGNKKLQLKIKDIKNKS